jgi:hypothetical protein
MLLLQHQIARNGSQMTIRNVPKRSFPRKYQQHYLSKNKTQHLKKGLPPLKTYIFNSLLEGGFLGGLPVE